MVVKPNNGLEEDTAPKDLAEAGSSGCLLQKHRGWGQGPQELAPTAPQGSGPWWHLETRWMGLRGSPGPREGRPRAGRTL